MSIKGFEEIFKIGANKPTPFQLLSWSNVWKKVKEFVRLCWQRYYHFSFSSPLSLEYPHFLWFLLLTLILQKLFINQSCYLFFSSVFSRGTRAQHLTLCGVCVCVWCVVSPGWMWCSNRSERKDNCTVTISVYSTGVHTAVGTI